MYRSIVCAVGTRPEVIKMAPVILRLRQSREAHTTVLSTGQHRELFDNAASAFKVEPDHDLGVMTHGQTLPQLTSRLISEFDRFLTWHNPDLVLVQGDTTTAMVCGLVCFYKDIAVGHVEAGLRTRNKRNPFPEEFNRVTLSHLADWHFCPTEQNRRNLELEGVTNGVHVTGNTGIDALLMIAKQSHPLPVALDPDKRLILATVHRRESFGLPLQRIAQALRAIARENRDTQMVLPVHPNPEVKSVIDRQLADTPNIALCAPLGYGELVELLKRSYLVISDSGGIQEEAPALGKPVLVLREETERQEAIDEGVARLVGTQTDAIVDAAQLLLDDADEYRRMARGASPYGDGHAAERIAAVLGL
jgi:UDP-N-acetylglucosamine 2-epimerase (non-hydrolysing)